MAAMAPLLAPMKWGRGGSGEARDGEGVSCSVPLPAACQRPSPTRAIPYSGMDPRVALRSASLALG